MTTDYRPLILSSDVPSTASVSSQQIEPAPDAPTMIPDGATESASTSREIVCDVDEETPAEERRAWMQAGLDSWERREGASAASRGDEHI